MSNSMSGMWGVSGGGCTKERLLSLPCLQGFENRIPSDHTFAAEHWHPLTRQEAMQRNPFYTSRLPTDAHLYSCDQLGDDGSCRVHETRPLVCRGYPWYGQPPRDMALADPDCGYIYDYVTEFVIRRPEM